MGSSPQASGPFSALQGIPLEYLISTPLMASARANMALGQVLCEFIDEIGFSPATGGGQPTTRLLTFNLTRPYQDPATQAMETQTIQVQAPLLALVPIPALLIQSVNIDLTVQVSTTMSSNSSESTADSVTGDDSWGFGKVSATGSFNASSSNQRSSNQSATYDVTIQALQQPSVEGMSKLCDIFASCIAPIPSTGGSGGGGGGS